MNNTLRYIEDEVYTPCAFKISNFKVEAESKGYAACNFLLNGLRVISRNAKITPKKTGQFVTFWKRKNDGPIEPFQKEDIFDFYIVNLSTENTIGQFVFPKSILIKKGIISTHKKEGKRGFRVYPTWDIPTSTQALRTQKWQLDYFYEIKDPINTALVKSLYYLDV
ncbi:hypothetical protein ULMS_09260 [Patiriisocius marinistellae]|uniref:MepB family protein n=1 Tax=Patiriisocius marinistellae TaxID=2494560 RepID=A0A5J4FW08_9FLAO|nr:MepB family protein [Patiriisocius marinistellae]GEQ85418.1 hypothetical protein ULMS_09260 [Patiriisocius marinistellae]